MIFMIIYLKNYFSHSNLYENIISHEIWFEIKSLLSHLYIFDYIIYIHVSDECHKKYINDKINYHFIHIYFIEYNKFDIIYKIWNSFNNNIIHVRYIIFDKILYYQNKDDLNQSFIMIELSKSQNSIIFNILAISFIFIIIELF